MINCKECIHYEVCSAWWVFVENFDDIRTEESCDYFKEKTTVDAEHVRHGRWIINGRLWECSICGETSNNTCMGEPRANYCPNCGAKMDGEKGEQE